MDNRKIPITDDNVRKLIEIFDMKNDVNRIINMLNFNQFNFFNVDETIKLIDEINKKYPENYYVCRVINNINTSISIPLQNATPLELMQELEWKRIYLAAKIAGKTTDEIKSICVNYLTSNLGCYLPIYFLHYML